jgi:hypothetical protein
MDFQDTDELTAKERVRTIAEGISTDVTRHNKRMTLIVAIISIMLIFSLFTIYITTGWPKPIPYLGIAPYLMLLILMVTLQVITLSRQWRLFWTVQYNAQRMDDRSGNNNMISSVLDYDLDGIRGIDYAKMKCRPVPKLLDPDIPISKLFSKESKHSVGVSNPLAHGEIADIFTRKGKLILNNYMSSEAFEPETAKKIRRVLFVLLFLLILWIIFWFTRTAIQNEILMNKTGKSQSKNEQSKSENKKKETSQANKNGLKDHDNSILCISTISEDELQEIQDVIFVADESLDMAEESMANSDISLELLSRKNDINSSIKGDKKDSNEQNPRDIIKNLAEKNDNIKEIAKALEKYYSTKIILLNKAYKECEQQQKYGSNSSKRKQAENTKESVANAISKAKQAQQLMYDLAQGKQSGNQNLAAYKKGLNPKGKGGKHPGTASKPNHTGGVDAPEPENHRIIKLYNRGRPVERGEWAPPDKPSSIPFNSFQKRNEDTARGFKLSDEGRKKAFSQLVTDL